MINYSYHIFPVVKSKMQKISTTINWFWETSSCNLQSKFSCSTENETVYKVVTQLITVFHDSYTIVAIKLLWQKSYTIVEIYTKYILYMEFVPI